MNAADTDNNSGDAESSSSASTNVLHLLQAEPENVAVSLVFRQADAAADGAAAASLQKELRGICSELFQRVEALNTLYSRIIDGRKEEEEEEPPSLSGLTQLYTGQEDDDDNDTPVDAETLFGQIELLNKALATKAKKSIKKISSSLEGGGLVRLLDEQDVSDSDQSDDDAREEVDSRTNDDDSSGGEEESDEERKRIEARMKRAMMDMDEDDDEQNNEDQNNLQAPRDEDDDVSSEESMVDPAAEELNDGFFDINEMEKFADEEEEYLPDEAFGEEKPDDEDPDPNKRSFHQKQRDGDFDDNNEEDSDEEANDLLFKKETTIRRKRYRDEDEIDALYELYQGNEKFGEENYYYDDDDSAMDAVNMTAADLYGKPNKKYYEKWNSKKTKRTDKSDDDSWDMYDFERSQGKNSAGWNDEDIDNDQQEEQRNSDSESDEERSSENNGNDDDNEQVPMKSGSEKGEKPIKKADKLTKQTEDMERELLAEKPWQMRGETVGTARPVESLLDSTPEFETATKQAPIITVEKTMSLEEVIKKRILDEDWDDVVPRELPDVAWNKKHGELPEVSQEKSKLGLGELYEREYMKKALGYDADKTEKETEEEKAKNEMKSLFANLCSKLDALSNYHFAPRPIADEAEVRPVTKPAIAMEEVLPLHFSDARGVAPEEVYGGKRGRDSVLRGESELEQQDRKRLRSAKKAARRKARKEKIADEKLISRLQPGLGLNNPYEKRKMREELSAARAQGKVTDGQADANKYGGSGTFFQRMQQEVQQSIKGASVEPGPGTKKKNRSKSSAVKL